MKKLWAADNSLEAFFLRQGSAFRCQKYNLQYCNCIIDAVCIVLTKRTPMFKGHCLESGICKFTYLIIFVYVCAGYHVYLCMHSVHEHIYIQLLLLPLLLLFRVPFIITMVIAIFAIQITVIDTSTMQYVTIIAIPQKKGVCRRLQMIWVFHCSIRFGVAVRKKRLLPTPNTPRYKRGKLGR